MRGRPYPRPRNRTEDRPMESVRGADRKTVKTSGKEGKVRFIRDGDVPSLELRIGAKGMRTWVMSARFGSAKNPTRRVVGDAHTMSVDDARAKVLEWRALNRRGIDPAEEAILARLEDERLSRMTFRKAMEDYVAWLPERKRNRRAAAGQKLCRREFLDPERNRWIDKPLHKVTELDVQNLIEAIRDRPAPTEAYNAFSMLRTFFKWILNPRRKDDYGIAHSPVIDLTNEHMELRKNKRKRTHNSDEIRAYWAATEATPDPWGPFFQALLLTGQRNRDVRNAVWSEFDLKRRMWRIPASRFKSNREQPVPLSVPMMQLLERIKALQSTDHGPYVFSTTDGWKPISGISNAMRQFRQKMVEIYAETHDEPLEPWVLHDDRRTVRSGLSNIGVPPEVAEAVIGHMKKDLEETYNTHSFKIQRRHALHLWAEELKYVIDDPERSLDAEENEMPEWPSRWNSTKPEGAR